MDYHVFKKPKIKNGKKIYKWYYYYTQNGKQIQKACKGCSNRSDAESYIRTLPPLNQKNNITIADVAQNMFILDSAHLKRRMQLGKSIDLKTIIGYRSYVKKIIQVWGNYEIENIQAKEILEYLFSVEHSGSWKNSYIYVFNEIFDEAIWYHCVFTKPLLPTFVRHSKKADILTTEELNMFFKEDNFPNEMMYLFFLLCLSAGMRLGEVRAVRVQQLVFSKKIIIINGFCKQNGERTGYNKTGSVDQPKFRIAYLPDDTVDKMQKWIDSCSLADDDFCFTQNGKPVRAEYAEKVFYRALQKIGLIPNGKGIKRLSPADGRKLVPHSLRYTYVSRMRRVMSAEDLKNYTGHTSTAMVDYYSRRSVELLLEGLPESGKRAANTLFS